MAVDEELFHDISHLSKHTITSAMILGNERLLGYRWAGFRQLRRVSCTLAIFLG